MLNVKHQVDFLLLLFFVSIRFHGTELSEKSFPVDVDLSRRDLHVDFSKGQKKQDTTEMLCTVFIILRSPAQVFY